jgi:hypothetical protein
MRRPAGPPRQSGSRPLTGTPTSSPTSPRPRAVGCTGPDLVTTLDALDRDHANLRAAHSHLLARGQPDRAAVLAWDVWLFLALRGHAGEWRARLAACETSSLGDVTRAGWLFTKSALEYVGRDLASARRDVAAAIAQARSHGDDDLAYEAGAMAALMATFVGDLDAADSLVSESRRPVGPIGDFYRVLLLASRGQRSILGGDPGAAEMHLERAEALARGTGNGFTIAIVLNMQATVAELRGDETATLDRLAESVQRSVEDGMGWTLGYALPALAAVAARSGQDVVAARLAGASAIFTGSTADVGHVPASRAGAHTAVEGVRARLGKAAYESAFAEGRALDLTGVGLLAASLRRLGPE